MVLNYLKHFSNISGKLMMHWKVEEVGYREERNESTMQNSALEEKNSTFIYISSSYQIHRNTEFIYFPF